MFFVAFFSIWLLASSVSCTLVVGQWVLSLQDHNRLDYNLAMALDEEQYVLANIKGTEATLAFIKAKDELHEYRYTIVIFVTNMLSISHL